MKHLIEAMDNISNNTIDNKSTKMTEDEKVIVNLLLDAWNSWCNLPNRKDRDNIEFQSAINAAQNKIAMRVAQRNNPGFQN